MEGFIYHEVSEKEKEQIRKDAKNLLENFGTKLEKIKTKESHFSSKINENGMREQGEPWKTNQDFRDLTLLNAPFVEEDFLVAEKGGWKK